jgi:hypothetical protein
MAKQPKTSRTLTHEQIWTALDRLAERAGLSPSALAKRSGLDPTTFNKSKRITPEGRERWPSTESVAKALAATNSSIDTFVQLIGDGPRSVQSVRCRLRAGGAAGYFDDGGYRRQGLGDGAARRQRRARLRWKFQRFDAAGLSRQRRHRGVAGHPIRRGDRVVVKTAAAGGRELKRRTAKTLELASLVCSCRPHAGGRRRQWIARINGQASNLFLLPQGERCAAPTLEPTSVIPAPCGQHALKHRGGAAPHWDLE